MESVRKVGVSAIGLAANVDLPERFTAVMEETSRLVSITVCWLELAAKLAAVLKELS